MSLDIRWSWQKIATLKTTPQFTSQDVSHEQSILLIKRRSPSVRASKSWNPVLRGFGTSTDRGFFFFFLFPALNCRRCCSGTFRIWFSGHGFQDLGSQLWGLGNFRIWFSGHGFRDLGSQLWGLGNFRIWFRTWFSRLEISTLGPGKF